MHRTLFILAPSDIQAQNSTERHAAVNGVTQVDVEVSGVLPILPFVMSDPTLRAHSSSIMLGLHKVNLAPGARINVFNLVGDADASPTMLRNIQSLVTKIEPLRCFNPPAHVFRTTREALPRTLADIPGCHVPRVERTDAADFGALEAACERFGCWPLIIRARGYHGGDNMVLVEDRAGLAAVRDREWLYRGVHLIEFVDYRGSNGLYQKWRVMLVDGEPYARHAVFSDRWAIHGGSRRDIMEADAGLRREEERSLAYMRDTGLRRFAPVFREMHRRIGLDIFGVDFAIVDDRIVVFEANACMNFLIADRPDNRYSYLEDYTRVLRRAVKKLLVRA